MLKWTLLNLIKASNVHQHVPGSMTLIHTDFSRNPLDDLFSWGSASRRLGSGASGALVSFKYQPPDGQTFLVRKQSDFSVFPSFYISDQVHPSTISRSAEKTWQKQIYIYIYFFFPSCSKYIPSIWISQFISHTWPGISTFHHRPETVVIRFLRRQEKLRELCGPYDVDMARVHKEDCERGKKVPFSLASGKRLRNELERSSMFNIWIYPLFLWWFSRAMLVYQVICWSFSSSMISVGLMARVYQFYGLNDQQIRELWSPSLW